MTVNAVPILVVDLVGSVAMIVLSFLCLNTAARLRRRAPDEILWTFLWWVCLAMVGFSLSRSAGHILRQILILTGHRPIWKAISPYSGAFNTLMFVLAASVTLYFERVWAAYQQILADKREIQAASRELVYLNQNLEELVAERTEALSRSEHKYRRIFELSRDIVMVTTPEGRILDMNPAGYEAFAGSDPQRRTPVGGRIQSLLNNVQDWEIIGRVIDANGFVTNAELVLVRPDGSRRMTLVSGSLDRSASGSDTVHLLIKDIEQRRQMERQLAQTDKLASIGEFSAGIAHEINNPLGIILGYTQLLLRRESAGSERHGDLKTIEKHVRNCKTIVEDLLNFARSSPPVKVRKDIHSVIDEVVQFIAQHARLETVRIERRYGSEIPLLLLDEKKIRQVMINLIMNARHAVGREGTIRIETGLTPDQGGVEVRVVDDGCGIEKQNLGRIFDPFFTTKPTGQGTGLGLSVSYGIVRNHGGDITVESTPGEGTTFCVRLPLGEDQKP
jgi:two-component system NtrC family sensor kinase